MKKLVSIVCSAMMVLSMAGCSSSSSSASSSSSDSSEGVYVTLAKENDVISMNSSYATDGMSLEIINATVEGLESMDADGNVIPGLAESYDVSDDGLTYTFHLRDASWDNGDPVTADDFVFAWNLTVHSPEAEYAYLFGTDGACIKNAEEAMENSDVDLDISAPDEKTFVVNLSKKCPYFLSLMTFPVFFPINEAFYESQSNGASYALAPENLLANGPYKLVSWTKDSSLKLDKNETYWDADNVNVDGLIINIVPEASTSALDFEGGNTDFTKLNSTLVDKYKDNEAYQSYLEGYLWYLQFNYDVEALQNQNIRLALATVIDRSDLVDNVLKDGSIAIGGFVPAQFTTGPDGKDYVESGTEYFTATGSDCLEAAKEFWEKGLKELGKDSLTLSLLYESSDPAKPSAEFIQSQLQQLPGLTIEMDVQDKENRIEKQKAGDFDIVLTRWGPDYADPTTYLNLMITGNAYNYGGYSNKDYDAKMQEAADAATDQERWDLLHEAEAILMEDVPVAGVFQVGGATLINPNVTGIEVHSFGTPYIYKNVTVTAE